MTRLRVSEAREKLSDTLNRVEYASERFVIQRRGKDVAAIVSLEDLELIERLEDLADVEAARAALREKGTVTWESVKKKAGL